MFFRPATPHPSSRGIITAFARPLPTALPAPCCTLQSPAPRRSALSAPPLAIALCFFSPALDLPIEARTDAATARAPGMREASGRPDTELAVAEESAREGTKE